MGDRVQHIIDLTIRATLAILISKFIGEWRIYWLYLCLTVRLFSCRLSGLFARLLLYFTAFPRANRDWGVVRRTEVPVVVYCALFWCLLNTRSPLTQIFGN